MGKTRSCSGDQGLSQKALIQLSAVVFWPEMTQLYGQVNKGDLPRQLSPVPQPCGEPLLTHASTRDPPTLAGSFGSVSCGVTALFLQVLVRGFLCPPSLGSVFLSPVEVL